MQLRREDKNINPELLRTIQALKAARIKKGYSRKDAALLLGWSPASFEQIENARCNFSKERLEKIVSAYGYSQKEFAQILRDPKRLLAELCSEGKKDKSIERKPRRNHYKIVTKEVRVIRILRKRKGISQYEASRLCGYVPGQFGHIEVGRIELTKERISHIVHSLGFSILDFENLMNAALLRDEIIEAIHADLHNLDDQSLSSAATIIKALIK